MKRNLVRRGIFSSSSLLIHLSVFRPFHSRLLYRSSRRSAQVLRMVSAAKSVVNCVSMATNGCLTSVPSPFTSAKALYSQTHIAIPAKPLKVQLSCSYSSISLPCLLSLKKQEPIVRVTAIAAQQEENNPVLLEEQGYEGSFNWDEPENETGGQNENAGDADEGYTFAEPSDELKVYVGNLPSDVDSEGLAKLFEEAGVVEIAEVIYNRDTDRSRGFGFVTMSTPEETGRAVQLFHRYDLGGRFLTVSKAAPKGSRVERPPRFAESSNRIYVGNLPWSINDNRLEQLFSEHGKVVSARVVSDRETGRSRGFGFVVMASESEMNDAIANLDGQNLDGRAIRVNVAEDRPRRGGF